MKLPLFFQRIIGQKKKEAEYFLSLLFTEEILKAAVWKKENGESQIIHMAEKEVGDGWDNIIKTADEVIALASGSIPQEKITKVIFGLPASFVKDNKIKDEYLKKLKKLSTDLSLTPIGFIVNEEAIIHHLSKIEGAPATVILIRFKKDKFVLTLSRIGKIEDLVEREKKNGLFLCEEIAKIFKENFKQVEVLPSKILLYDGQDDLENIKQDLISFPWLSKAEFLHFPKIEIMEPNFDLKALVSSTAMEMGIEVEKKEEIIKENALPITPASIQTEMPQKQTEKSPELVEVVPKKMTDDFGFIKDKDIVEEAAPSMPDLSVINEDKMENNESDKEKEKILEESKLKPIKKWVFPSLNIKLPKISIPSFTLFKNLSSLNLIILAILIIFMVFGGIIYWFLPKATITLLVTPKVYEKEMEITIDPKIDTTSADKKTIPGKEIEVEESGNKKILTTGKKIIGDKAKGEVTIFNKTNYSKTFKSGTVLSAGDNLKFILDNDVTIASQSASTSSSEITTLNPGKTKIKLTASQIGAESNLAKGTEFKVEDFSTDSFKAKNEDDALSGGTSREVSVVSEEDQKKIKQSLVSELTTKAKKNLSSKITSNYKIINQAIQTSIIETKYSKDVGDETKELSLVLTIKVKTLAFNTNDLNDFIITIISKGIPEGYEYKKEEVKTEIKEAKIEKDKKVALRLFFKINLFPKINSEQIKKDLAGKNPNLAQDYLKTIPNVVGFEFDINPKFPGFLYTFPRVVKNISLIIKKK